MSFSGGIYCRKCTFQQGQCRPPREWIRSSSFNWLLVAPSMNYRRLINKDLFILILDYQRTGSELALHSTNKQNETYSGFATGAKVSLSGD